MEETKWLTKGKIIAMIIILLIISGIVISILVHRNNLKKDYIKFENQLEYAAPNYLLKEKIKLVEDEWREITIKDIMSQKLVINKRASDCEGYVIAEAHKNIDNISEDSIDEDKKDNDITQDENSNEIKKEEANKKVSNNISYKAYVSCKKIYKTKNYGTKPSNKNKNEEETQTQNDTEKPVIELFGDEEITLKVGDKYEEFGAVATDNIDGDITSKIKITGKVNTNKVGTYTIKYTVSDSSKNKTTKQRTVIVEEKEEVEETPIETPVNPETPTEPEVPSTPAPTPVTPTQPTTPAADTTSPVIIFNDNSLYQTICEGNKADISSGGAYGYIARDNVDGNITGKVKITGDTGIINRSGVYNLYYEVYDNSGNVARATKQFTVKNCSSSIPSTTTKVLVSGLKLTPNNRTLNVSDTLRLTVTINPSNADDKTVIFTSSNPSVASVSTDGTIKALSKGGTIITATSSNGKTATCTITVN